MVALTRWVTLFGRFERRMSLRSSNLKGAMLQMAAAAAPEKRENGESGMCVRVCGMWVREGAGGG